MNPSEHEGPPEKAQKSFWGKLLHSAIARIILGSIAIFLVGMLIKWFFEPLLLSIGLEENIAKTIRYILTIVAMLSTYYWLFTYYERRKVTELARDCFFKDSLLGITLAFLSISTVMLTLYLGGYFHIIAINDKVLHLLFPLVFIALMGTLEELIFRGVLYRIIETRLGTNLALIVSGLFFGLSAYYQRTCHAPQCARGWNWRSDRRDDVQRNQASLAANILSYYVEFHASILRDSGFWDR